MFKTLNHDHLTTVELEQGVLLQTPIPTSHLPALRSGFAGYPANPRWTAAKFHAWKTGRQLRQAVACGQMVVRASDSMLVPAQAREEANDEPPSTLPPNLYGGSQIAWC